VQELHTRMEESRESDADASLARARRRLESAQEDAQLMRRMLQETEASRDALLEQRREHRAKQQTIAEQISKLSVDAAGNDKETAEITTSHGVSSWTEMTMDLNYSNTAVKAASIFMTFRSSTKSHPSVRKRKLTYYNSDDDNHYIGTVLRVDDVELLY